MSIAEIPITVINSPLGTGEMTLINRLLNDPDDRRIAVVVNDMDELNVDAGLIASESDDGVIDLSNGCICCRLQDDLVIEMTQLTENRSFDYLLIEISGVSEPLPITRTLTSEPNEGGLPDHPRLDTTIPVISTCGSWRAFDPAESLPDAAPDPERSSAEVLVEQVELYGVLSLNRCDMVSDDALDAARAEIQELRPRASICRTTYNDVDPTRVLDAGCFDFKAAKRRQGWKQALTSDGVEADHGHGHDHIHGEGILVTKARGIESFIYCRGRPFHSQCLDAQPNDWRGNVIRAKGFTWVASRPKTVLDVSQAGPPVQAGLIGRWEDDVPQTRLVFIGRDLDEDAMIRELDRCLATTDERGVACLDDPLPREFA